MKRTKVARIVRPLRTKPAPINHDGPTVADLRAECEVAGGTLADVSGQQVAVLACVAPERQLWGGQRTVIRASWAGTVDRPKDQNAKDQAIGEAIRRIREYPPE